MRLSSIKIILAGLLVFSVSACSLSPVYINEAAVVKGQAQATGINPIHFKFDPEFHRSPPQYVAVMPLRKQFKTTFLPETGPEISDIELKQLRRVLYSHLAPYPYKDVELARVNKRVKKYSDLPVSYSRLAKHLACDSLLLGEVTDYETKFFGVYSQTSVGIKLRLVRAKDNQLLWQGRDVAASHGGSLPLTPVDVALGLYSATSNISDEQIIRVGDDLFPRLLLTGDRSEELEQRGVMQAKSGLGSSSFYVTTYYLNLRSGPGMKYSADTVLKRNDVLTLMNERHIPWLQVQRADGKLGYVHQRYILAY